MSNETTHAGTVLPAYVGLDGPVYPQPFTLQNIRMYGFMLPGNIDSIQQNVCDRWFNAPSGGTENFRAASSYVLLACLRIQSIASQVPPYNSYGGFPEQEIGFWVLMADQKRGRLCWTTPYLFVDSSYAVAAGRETYGFPKQMGNISLPPAPVPDGQYTMDALVLDEYAPQSMARISRILTAQHSGTAPSASTAGELKSLEGLLLSLFKTMEVQENLFQDLQIAIDSGSDLLHGRLPFVFLKQFRDVTDGSRACYQSIVEATMQERAFHSAAWLPSCEININSYASVPLHDDLGLSSGPIQSVMSFTTDSDYDLEPGVELWKA